MEKTSEITIVATAIALNNEELNLRREQETLVAETLKEKGCIRDELHQSKDDPRVLVFVETWASEQDWRAHMQGEAIKKFQASGAARWIADFTLHRMTKIAG
ncbi:Quinol monooxygenase YgiN [Flavobacterium anhuiense]|uniref:Quinol monooxygenase YgiN n=1 Tax=Flavobacterium anhuiense TaxID=459526 RepID=A0ABY0LG96_9FLAO|nr:putative quinol monooxygenase [Flavobacterium anhuiense]SCY14294.1 Quinol monooxygenase YgiN [Flavobacterium anhuiense]